MQGCRYHKHCPAACLLLGELHFPEPCCSLTVLSGCTCGSCCSLRCLLLLRGGRTACLDLFHKALDPLVHELQ